jgi:histidyl-tRNA synthetase
MKQADRVGARWVAILGDEGASLKDMESGEQREVEMAAVIPDVQRGYK